MTEILTSELSRKTFLKGGGALVVGFSMAGSLLGAKAAAAAATRRALKPSGNFRSMPVKLLRASARAFYTNTGRDPKVGPQAALGRAGL